MDDYEFEMPTPCSHCGEIFDLNDGRCSDKWYPDTTICEACSVLEQEEIEEDSRWEETNTDLSNILYDFKQVDCWRKLSEENIRTMKDIIAAVDLNSKKDGTPMRVFKITCGDYYYGYTGGTPIQAIDNFKAELGEDEIDEIEEIPESEWDKKEITIYEDNDTSKNPFFVSIREVMDNSCFPSMIFTNDFSGF